MALISAPLCGRLGALSVHRFFVLDINPPATSNRIMYTAAKSQASPANPKNHHKGHQTPGPKRHPGASPGARVTTLKLYAAKDLDLKPIQQRTPTMNPANGAWRMRASHGHCHGHKPRGICAEINMRLGVHLPFVCRPFLPAVSMTPAVKIWACLH